MNKLPSRPIWLLGLAKNVQDIDFCVEHETETHESHAVWSIPSSFYVVVVLRIVNVPYVK